MPDDEPLEEPRTPDRASSWRDVARVALHHHLRGPWAVAVLGLALVGPLLLLLSIPAYGHSSFVAAPYLAAYATFPLLPVIPVLAFLLVLPAYRGPWLRDPAAAPPRILGFFTATWGALAAALVPWAVFTFLVAGARTTFAAALLPTLVEAIALAFHGGIWIALALAVSALFRREESRWVAALVLWAGLAHVLPGLADLAVQAWRLGSDVAAGPLDVPPWAILLDALQPPRLVALFSDSIVPKSPYASPLGPLDTPLFYLPFLGAWIAGPLLVAVTAQARGNAPAPAHVL